MNVILLQIILLFLAVLFPYYPLICIFWNSLILRSSSCDIGLKNIKTLSQEKTWNSVGEGCGGRAVVQEIKVWGTCKVFVQIFRQSPLFFKTTYCSFNADYLPTDLKIVSKQKNLICRWASSDSFYTKKSCCLLFFKQSGFSEQYSLDWYTLFVYYFCQIVLCPIEGIFMSLLETMKDKLIYSVNELKCCPARPLKGLGFCKVDNLICFLCFQKAILKIQWLYFFTKK